MKRCLIRHWASDEPCLRGIHHESYHVGADNIWNDDGSAYPSDLIAEIDRLEEALDHSEHKIDGLETEVVDLEKEIAHRDDELEKMRKKESA